jgi:hypothetical protein
VREEFSVLIQQLTARKLFASWPEEMGEMARPGAVGTYECSTHNEKMTATERAGES